MVNHLRSTARTGRIVNISSVHEELPFPNFSAYCASKGGLKMLTRNLAVELGPLGHRDQFNCTWCDRDTDQHEAAERPGQAAGTRLADSARTPREAGRCGGAGGVSGVGSGVVRDGVDVLRGRRAHLVLSGAVVRTGDQLPTYLFSDGTYVATRWSDAGDCTMRTDAGSRHSSEGNVHLQSLTSQRDPDVPVHAAAARRRSNATILLIPLDPMFFADRIVSDSELMDFYAWGKARCNWGGL